MTRRGDRRRRIEESFDRFRRAVANFLGVAANRQSAASLDHARLMFELWLRETGVDRLPTDETLARCLPNRSLRPVLDRAVAERDEVFRPWTTRGPERLADLVRRTAPGAAGDAPRDWLGRPGTSDGTLEGGGTPQLWRVGTARVDAVPDSAPFPVAVPLLDGAHLHISSTPKSRITAETMVESLLLRVFSHFQPGLVHLHVWDVGQLTGSLPGLYPLARAGLLTVHDPARPHDLLDELAEHIRRIHTSVLVDGRPSLGALSEETGRRKEPWRVAVLFGNRSALREEQQQKLQRIARNGLSCGVVLILVDLPVTVNSAVESLRLGDDQTARCTMTGAHVTVTPDPPLPRELVPRACGAIADEMVDRRSRVSTFADLLPGERWSYRSSSGVQAPVGHHDGEPVYVSLGDTAPHALIGGPSGSGKTNFLYALLGGLTARYSPDELELYLLDFKEGVSFAQFAPGRKDPSWLPHARLVGVNVNQDREFGLALLRFLAEEMRRRANRAKLHEVTKLEELRAEDPEGRWPRIVAVIDEFQYLFADRDEVTHEAAALLEDVARRGRSQGIHLVLSSQDVSGIEAFWGKPAIFEQFIMRIALPKARRVLTETNLAAMEIPRWHAVINHDSGVPYGNEVARVPDSTSRGTFDRLQVEMWRSRTDSREPTLFDGSRVPRLRDLPDFQSLGPDASASGRGPVALLGQVIDVAGSAARLPLERTPGRNLAVLGSAREDACRVLSAAARSLSEQWAEKARFTVLCFVDDAERQASELARFLTDRHGPAVPGGGEPITDPSRLPEVLAEVAAGVTGNDKTPGPHYLLLFGADAALPKLEERGTGMRTGLDDLKAVLRHGPERGTHVLSWWRATSRLRNALLMGGGLDDIGAFVALDVHGQELSSLAANQVISWSPRPQRGLFFDRAAATGPQVLIPCEVDLDPAGGDAAGPVGAPKENAGMGGLVP
ncbi:FtsK/SpoIIIE domain-containing protein [Actinoalloteichus caeruleus]|uniref:FtsK/SpoIIIE domain-containing protein n=1 Tax=Actinoalloteichus cyanogriseus TaxID=2893586 RepID=UPI00055050BB|nr:FtsK/SpoIIIE domain-containing protein [Actinoalloteichus caeruleus]